MHIEVGRVHWVGADARRHEVDLNGDTLRDYLRMCDQALQSRSATDCPVVET
jgi:hypothetical protein